MPDFLLYSGAEQLMELSELAKEIADSMETVGCDPLSATIYGSVASGVDDSDSDVDVLCVVESIPNDDVLGDLEDLLDYRIQPQVNVSWMSIEPRPDAFS